MARWKGGRGSGGSEMGCMVVVVVDESCKITPTAAATSDAASRKARPEHVERCRGHRARPTDKDPLADKLIRTRAPLPITAFSTASAPSKSIIAPRLVRLCSLRCVRSFFCSLSIACSPCRQLSATVSLRVAPHTCSLPHSGVNHLPFLRPPYQLLQGTFSNLLVHFRSTPAGALSEGIIASQRFQHIRRLTQTTNFRYHLAHHF